MQHMMAEERIIGGRRCEIELSQIHLEPAGLSRRAALRSDAVP
jgi:hypothetical protein